MKYTYIEAWTLIGVIIPEDTQSYEIGHSVCCRFIITRDPNDILTMVDRRLAIGNFMLGDGGLAKLENDDKALPSAIKKIQAKRSSKIMDQAVLVVEAQGETEASLHEPFREFDEFIVSFEGIDKDKRKNLVKIHQSDIEAIKVALAIESEVPLKFNKLSEGIYFTNDKNKTIYDISFSMNGSMFSSRRLTAEGADRVFARYNLLRKTKDMGKVQRLFSIMADYNNTPLLAFISGWTGLEILVNKLFKTHKKLLNSENESLLREKFLERKNQNTKDPSEFTLMDKFILSVLKLFPDDIDDDCEKFSNLKKLRNSVHNKEFSQPDLPVNEIATLLIKYLRAYIK